MISYVKGILSEVTGGGVVVEAGNLGYFISVPASVPEQLPKIGEEVKLYTYFQVKEDGASLYGFLSRQDLEMFRMLIGVNGIGPRGALGLLSALSPDTLRMAIVSEDAKAISRAPGIGAKTAQRIILDLKDKISNEDLLPGSCSLEMLGSALTGASQEAVEALIALGYSFAEASGAVKKAEIKEDMSAEDVLRASLKHLTFL